MKQRFPSPQFAICVNNKGYAASLETRKVYQVLPDPGAARHRLVRIVDESGEDYLYPLEHFAPIRLPQVLAQAFAWQPNLSAQPLLEPTMSCRQVES